MSLKGFPTFDPSRSTWILMAMWTTGYQMYEGTVPRHVKARRRAKNKVARKSRRLNRAR